MIWNDQMLQKKKKAGKQKILTLMTQKHHLTSSLVILMLQWKNHGLGDGDVQHEVNPLVWNLRQTAGETDSRRLPLAAAHSLLLWAGSAGTIQTFWSNILSTFFFVSFFKLSHVFYCLFQSISGLRLTDTFLKRTYEYDDIAQVCVVCPFMSNES